MGVDFEDQHIAVRRRKRDGERGFFEISVEGVWKEGGGEKSLSGE